MKFNPNNNEYDKINPNLESIMDEVTDIEIYRYYIGAFKVGKPFSSPLSEDKNPSFNIFASKKAPGRLFFKDFRGPSGSSIKLIQLLFNCTYKQALERIIVDFQLDDKFNIESDIKQLKPVEYRLDKSSRKEYLASKLDLKIISRGWKPHDIDFWRQCGISMDTLEAFNVVPISYYSIYGKPFKADKYAYAYKEYKDGETNYKIYQPFRDTHNHKFINGFLDGTFSGWELLPFEGDLLLMSKSAKDTMFLFEHGYCATSPQGEGYTFKPQVIDILKSRFKRIVTFYDHDNAGIKAAKRNRKEFGFEFVTTCDFSAKDTTDFYIKYGLSETLELLEEILK
jgi:hypothetical protein